MLRDATFYQGLPNADRSLPAAAIGPALFWQCPEPPNLHGGTSPEPPLKVILNHGRWIVQCPDCNGGQFASEEDKRFLCNECGNIAAGRLWRAIEWPKNRHGIEAAVEVRKVANQNWLPGETVEDLQAGTAFWGGA